jgi:hypothetical protein
VEDGELHLTLNTILTCLSHLATADQIQELERCLVAIEPSPASPTPFRSPHSACSLSPLPLPAPLTTFPIRPASVPPLPTPPWGLVMTKTTRRMCYRSPSCHMMMRSHPGLILKSYAQTFTSPGKTALGRPPLIVASLTNTSALDCPMRHALLDSPINAAVYSATQNE